MFYEYYEKKLSKNHSATKKYSLAKTVEKILNISLNKIWLYAKKSYQFLVSVKFVLSFISLLNYNSKKC